MRDIQLFLRLLSERVYHLRDASDLKDWLLHASDLASELIMNSQRFAGVDQTSASLTLVAFSIFRVGE
jgi:hypothetical protein